MLAHWQSNPPWWLRRAHRYFPHPLVAAIISLPLVILSLMSIAIGLAGHRHFFLVSAGFAFSSFATMTSAWMQLRIRRQKRREEKQRDAERLIAEGIAPAVVPTVASHGAPTFTIVILLTAVFTTMTLFGLQIQRFRHPEAAENLKFSITMALCLLTNAYMRFHGRFIIADHYARRGKGPIVLTGLQCLIVAVIAISFSCYLQWVL